MSGTAQLIDMTLNLPTVVSILCVCITVAIFVGKLIKQQEIMIKDIARIHRELGQHEEKIESVDDRVLVLETIEIRRDNRHLRDQLQEIKQENQQNDA